MSAQSEANEYMIEYNDCAKRNGREEHVVGWYHSHPGYGCWLSGIDVDTQSQNQMFTDPYLAIVVDPVRSQASGRVEIGAFRTYPEGYTDTSSSRGGRRMGGGGGSSSGVGDFVPSAKIEDYGVHKDKYYELPISIFKSTLDGQILKRLWDEYWASTFTSMPLSKGSGAKNFVDASVKDVAQKMSKIDASRGFLVEDEFHGFGGLGGGGQKGEGGRAEMEEEEGGMRALLLDDDDANVAAAGNGSGGGGKERKETAAAQKNSGAAATATTSLLDAKSKKLSAAVRTAKSCAPPLERRKASPPNTRNSPSRALNERLFCRAATFCRVDAPCVNSLFKNRHRRERDGENIHVFKHALLSRKQNGITTSLTIQTTTLRITTKQLLLFPLLQFFGDSFQLVFQRHHVILKISY